MGAAEDGNGAICRPRSEDTEQLDALDIAHYVCLVNSVIPQRAGSFLGDFKYLQNRFAVLDRWVGRPG